MEPPATEKSDEKGSPESININSLLDEANKLTFSQEQSKKMKMKRHHLNLDEVENLVKNFENLPFKLGKKDFEKCKADLGKFEDLKTKTEKVMSQIPKIGEFDELLIGLNALIFESPLLVKVREIYDDCSYILEMA